MENRREHVTQLYASGADIPQYPPEQVEDAFLVKVQDPTHPVPNEWWVPLPFGNCRGCRFFVETAFPFGACTNPRITAEQFPAYSRRSDCPEYAEGGTGPMMARVIRHIGPSGNRREGMTDETDLVVMQVVPWTKFQADQQSKQWMLIARDIDRGLAHDLDPAADYGQFDPSPPTEASAPRTSRTSSRCADGGSGGDSHAAISRQPGAIGRHRWTESDPPVAGRRSRKVPDVRPLVLDDFPHPRQQSAGPLVMDDVTVSL